MFCMLTLALLMSIFSRIAVFRFILDLVVLRGKRLLARIVGCEAGASLSMLVVLVVSFYSMVFMTLE